MGEGFGPRGESGSHTSVWLKVNKVSIDISVQVPVPRNSSSIAVE